MIKIKKIDYNFFNYLFLNHIFYFLLIAHPQSGETITVLKENLEDFEAKFAQLTRDHKDIRKSYNAQGAALNQIKGIVLDCQKK